jgi:hypothetical protein
MKEYERKELERLEALRKTIEASPLTKQIQAEQAAAVLGERLLTAAKLRAATEEAEKVIPEYQREVDALVADLAEYDKGRSVSLDKLTSARVKLMKERQRLDWDQSQASAALLSNYDPHIDEAITFFRDRFEGLRVKDINKQTRTGERNLFTEKQEVFTYSNAAAIKNALAYCRAAIEELERMKLTPDPDADRIETLRKGIPDADELTESTGKKPLPGSKGISFASQFKSDSQQDWEVGKLLERGKKILSAPKRV